jgi:hypothetical protein
MATPGLLRALFHLLVEEMRRAEQLDDDVSGDVERGFVPFGAAARGLAAQRTNLAFEVANTSLSRVTANHQPQGIVADGQLLRR